MDDSGSVEGLTAASSLREGRDEEPKSFESEVTFPDNSKDRLRVGRVCRGFCLSRSVFQQSSLAMVRQHGRRCPSGFWTWTSSFVARQRRKSIISPGKLARKLARKLRGRMRPFALQELSRGAANHRVLESLRRRYGTFFGDYRHNLVVRERISCHGAQGEIRAATWRCDDGCEYDVVVKMLKLQHGSLEALLSQGMLGRMAELQFDSYALHCATLIYKATLLRDGRIGLVMRRYACNLRELIQRRMTGAAAGRSPFERHEALHLMHEVASGMRLLHANGVLHRDLNPANVLILESDPIRCYVADFEVNGDVSGTGFFRSPEVLQGVSMRDAAGVLQYQRHSDVYSFAMTCVELCTGLVPLQNHSRSDYEFVLEGRRPELPDSIAPQVRALIARCWHQEPSLRPTFDMIVQELDAMIRS